MTTPLPARITSYDKGFENLTNQILAELKSVNILPGQNVKVSKTLAGTVVSADATAGGGGGIAGGETITVSICDPATATKKTYQLYGKEV